MFSLRRYAEYRRSHFGEATAKRNNSLGTCRRFDSAPPHHILLRCFFIFPISPAAAGMAFTKLINHCAIREDRAPSYVWNFDFLFFLLRQQAAREGRSRFFTGSHDVRLLLLSSPHRLAKGFESPLPTTPGEDSIASICPIRLIGLIPILKLNGIPRRHALPLSHPLQIHTLQ